MDTVIEPITTTKPAQRPKRARITKQDCEQIAKLVALRFSERMACIKLDVPYVQWLKWKSRAGRTVVYDSILTRMRADKCANMLESIEDAAKGNNGVRHDWRAAREMLNITAREVYSDQDASPATAQPVISQDRWAEIVKLATTQAQPAIDCQPVRQVADCQIVSSVTVYSEGVPPDWMDSGKCNG